MNTSPEAACTFSGRACRACEMTEGSGGDCRKILLLHKPVSRDATSPSLRFSPSSPNGFINRVTKK